MVRLPLLMEQWILHFTGKKGSILRRYRAHGKMVFPISPLLCLVLKKYALRTLTGLCSFCRYRGKELTVIS